VAISVYNRGGPFSTAVGAGEKPVLAADGNTAQGALGGVIGQADAAVAEEAGEGDPALEHAMALATSAWRDSRARSPRIQFSSSLTSGAMRVVRTARRDSADNPLISRSIAKIASIWRTACGTATSAIWKIT